MNSVEILGISGYEKTTHLKVNVVKALKDLQLEIQVEEVSDVDALVESNISAIPALRVNGKVVVQQTVPCVEDLKILLKALLQSSKNSIKIKNIIVPTDFSKTAKGAFLFALEFAKAKDALLKLVHCYHSEVDPAFPYLATNSLDFLEGKKELLNRFKNPTLPPNEGGIATTVKVETELLTGFAAEEIVRLSPDVDMIVMGTTGQSGFMKKLFGSISSHVAQKAHCPVLLIPNGVEFKGFRNVLYVSNYQAADEVMLQQVIDFASLFDTNIHFVHGVENFSHDSTIKEMKFEQIFRKKVPSLDFNMVTIENNTVPHGIQQYASKNAIDLVVMATSHRSFIENILHKSMTKRMVFNAEIPLMVMHIDD